MTSQHSSALVRTAQLMLIGCLGLGFSSCGDGDSADFDAAVGSPSTTDAPTTTLADTTTSTETPSTKTPTTETPSTETPPTQPTTTNPPSTEAPTTAPPVTAVVGDQPTEVTFAPDGTPLFVLGEPGPPASPQQVKLNIVSAVPDVSSDELAETMLSILNDSRGWPRAGFTFERNDQAPYRVILAEGPEVDRLCLPLKTGGRVSCQNGPVVALNADRWRNAVIHWDADVDDYRGYLVNHEVGHLIGQRHPQPRCPRPGAPAAVMEQQTGGLAGCLGNAWPRDWEIDLASRRPAVYAPIPAWGPDPVPTNAER